MYIYIHRVTIIYKGIMFKNMLISSTWFYKQHETGAGNEYYFLFLCYLPLSNTNASINLVSCKEITRRWDVMTMAW